MKLHGIALLAASACVNAHDARAFGKRQSYNCDGISKVSDHIGVNKEIGMAAADTTITMTATVFPEPPYSFDSSSSSISSIASANATVTVTQIVNPELTSLTYTSKWSNLTGMATSYGATVVVTATVHPEGPSIPMSTSFSNDAATATHAADTTATVTVHPEVPTGTISEVSSEHDCSDDPASTSALISAAASSVTTGSVTPLGTHTVSLTWSLSLGGWNKTSTTCHETDAATGVSAVSGGVATVTNVMGWPTLTSGSSVAFASSVDPVTAPISSSTESSEAVTVTVTPTSTIHLTSTVVNSESVIASESVTASSDTVSHETLFSTIASTITVPGTTSMTTESCMAASTVYTDTTIVTSTVVLITGPTEPPTGAVHDTIFVTVTEYFGFPSSSYPGLPSSAGGILYTDTSASSTSCTSAPWITVYVTASETQPSAFSISEIAVPVTSSIDIMETYTTASTDGIAVSEPTTMVYSGVISVPWASTETIPGSVITEDINSSAASISFSIESWTPTLSVPAASLVTSSPFTEYSHFTYVSWISTLTIPTTIAGSGNVTTPANNSMNSPILVSDGGVSTRNLAPRVPRSIWSAGSGDGGGGGSGGSGTMCVVMFIALIGVLIF